MLCCRLEEGAGLELYINEDAHNFEVEIVYSRWGEATVDGGKKLILGGLYHDFQKHNITGAGLAFWKEGDHSERYVKEGY